MNDKVFLIRKNSKFNLFLFLLFVFLTCFSGLGVYSSMSEAMEPLTQGVSDSENWFVFSVFFIVHLYFIFRLIWMSFGKEFLYINEEFLIYLKKVSLFKYERKYLLSKTHSFTYKVHTSNDVGIIQLSENLKYFRKVFIKGFSGVLCFKYKFRKVNILENCSNSEVVKLIHEINKYK